VSFLPPDERASLFRGAGTPLYMAPEQRRGAAPDPRHDLYSLGVMWFQLLVDDVTRELHPGWAKELTVRFRVPRAHIDLIERCVGWLEERPGDAGELLGLLRAAEGGVVSAAAPAASSENAGARPPASADDGGRKRLLILLSEMQDLLGKAVWMEPALTLKNQRIDHIVTELIQTYPETVQSWGGTAALRNPNRIKAILKSFSPAPPVSDAERARRLRQVVLASQLKKLRDSLDRVERLGRPALLPGAVGGFFLGCVVGLLSGVACHGAFPSSWKADYDIAIDSGTIDVRAAIFGLIAGSAVWLVWVLLQAIRRPALLKHARGTADVLAREVADGYPDEVKAWGGPGVLRNRDAVAALLDHLEAATDTLSPPSLR
jgi:hypothetical protein